MDQAITTLMGHTMSGQNLLRGASILAGAFLFDDVISTILTSPLFAPTAQPDSS